jgi:hypothetical protein
METDLCLGRMSKELTTGENVFPVPGLSCRVVASCHMSYSLAVCLAIFLDEGRGLSIQCLLTCACARVLAYVNPLSYCTCGHRWPLAACRARPGLHDCIIGVYMPMLGVELHLFKDVFLTWALAVSSFLSARLFIMSE